MYISRTEFQTEGGKVAELLTDHETLQTNLKGLPGFRWAMLLRSVDDANKMASVEMWLNEEQAPAPGESSAATTSQTYGYDVTTARGSMTPASFAAIVEWQIPEQDVKAFTDRWNAAYHHVEDRISSRLLRDLRQPSQFVGFHVAQSGDVLTPEVLSAELREGEKFSVRPIAVWHYSVGLLTEG